MKALKRTLKISAYAGATLLVLIGMIAGLTQTQFFKDRLRTIIVSNLSQQLNGSLYLGTISGNLVTGFAVDSIVIYQQSEPVISANKILFSYDPLSFFRNAFKANYLIIENPTISLRRTAQGKWNIDELIKPSENPASGTFEGSIDITDVRIKRGKISLIDSLSLVSPGHQKAEQTEVEYHQLDLHDVNILFSLHIQQHQYRLHVEQANFSSQHPEFELSHFKGDFYLDDKRLSVNNAVVQTGGSSLELDAEIHGVNVFNGFTLAQLQHDSTRLHLKANNISFAELKSFLPPVNFLEGSARVECDAHGEFGNLSIQRLNIQTYQTSLTLTGTLRNLHRPEELYIDAQFGESKLNPEDVHQLLPTFNLPSFGHVGLSTFSAEFKGTPLKFAATTLLAGAYGSIQLKGEMNLERSMAGYHALFSTAHVDLGLLAGSKNFTTSLTTSGELRGNGFSLDTLTGDLNLKLASSRIQGLVMDTATVIVHAIPHHVDLTASYIAQGSKASLKTRADITNRKLPKYSAEISCTAFDISALLNDATYASDISLHGTLAASGTTIDDINGQADLFLLPSTYQHRSLPAEEVAIRLDQREDNNKELTLESSFANVSCRGRFDIDLVIDALVRQSVTLIRSIKQHALPPDYVHQAPVTSKLHILPHTVSQRVMDFSYAISVNDLTTIAILAGEKDFNARGTLNGTIKGTDDQLSITADGAIDEFFIGSINNGIFLNNTALSLHANNLTPTQTLEQLSGKLNLSIGSGIFQKTAFDQLLINLNYQQLKGKLSVKGVLDSTYTILLSGETSIQPNTYAFDLDTLMISSGGYRWKNDQDIQIRANDEGVRVLHADMKRNEESFSLAGALLQDGTIDLTGKLHKLDLTGLGVWLRNPGLTLPGRGFSGKFEAEFRFSGSTRSPVISFTAAGESTYYQQTRIGHVQASIKYEHQSANIDVDVKPSRADTKSTLTIKGTIPIDLAFSHVDERFPDQEQQLDIVSDGFDIGVLDPLIADVDELSGTVRCNVHIAGSPRDPQYSGIITLSNVQCIFGPNNIPYIVNGELEPSGNKLTIKTLTATNPPSEPQLSDARFVGSAVIKNFRIETFDVTTYGTILLMTEATRKMIPTFYGTLFAEIDPSGLNLRGTLDEPFLSGKLYSKNTDLLFPPTKYTEGVNTKHILRYIALDTSKAKPATNVFAHKFFDVPDSGQTGEAVIRSTAGPSFIDRLRYNLEVETRGTTAIRMIFTPSTNEELYAEIEGKASVVNTRGTPTIYGDISVTSRSYYNFFKRFVATGKLKFVGPWDNPELDIDANYESYHQRSTAKTSDQSLSGESQISVQEKVIVELKITGTRYEPKLQIGMKVQKDPGQDPVDYTTQTNGGDAQSDAISFILTGKFRDELSSSERDNLATNFGSAGVSGLTSNLLSGVFTDFLRKEFPFIRNAEFSYQGGNVQESADVGITGEAFKGYWRIRGKILNDIGNANLTYQTSVGDIFNLSSIRNLFIELERRVEGTDANATSRLTTNNARLFYRISF